MKKILTLSLVAAAALILINCKGREQDTGSSDETVTTFDIPDDVMAVINHSCYGCHNSESQNEKAKKDLKFDELDSLKNFVLIGLLDEIYEHVDSAKMPPPRFLERYPDRALTNEQKELLLTWSSETADNLAGK